MTRLRIGTRGSQLATTQSGTVAAALEAHGCATELVTVRTFGDDHRGSLAAMPQQGVFVSALREALLAGEVDVAVHSMKDLPSAPAEGIVLAAAPAREDPRDALVTADGRGLDALPAGARIGTGSPRRQARVRALRPDLEVVDLRGNVDSRLARVDEGDLDAVVLAVAGLTRLGRAGRIAERLDPARMLPAPAQGALAVECRADDAATVALLARLDDSVTRLSILAERAVLAGVQASCASAIGALARLDDTRLTVTADASGAAGEHASLTRTATLPVAPGAGEAPGEARAVATALGHAAAEALLAAGAGSFLVR
ncbi:MAG: hydroxymethylbilane synthase [Nitriliruptoraceae bacterium]